MFMSLCNWVQMPTEVRGIRSCGAGVTDVCESPDVGGTNQTWGLSVSTAIKKKTKHHDLVGKIVDFIL